MQQQKKNLKSPFALAPQPEEKPLDSETSWDAQTIEFDQPQDTDPF